MSSFRDFMFKDMLNFINLQKSLIYIFLKDAV